MKVIKLLSFILVFLGVFSCSIKRNYEFIVQNDTDYHLHVVAIGNSKIEVGARSSSAPFEVTFKKNFADLFTQPLAGIGVETYSDSANTYENTRGGVVGENKLKEAAMNYAIVELDTISAVGNDIFSIRIE